MPTIYETIDAMTLQERTDFTRVCRRAYAYKERFITAYTHIKSSVSGYENQYTSIASYTGQFKFIIDGCGTGMIGIILDYLAVDEAELSPVVEVPTEPKHINMYNAIPTAKPKSKKSTFIHQVKDKFREHFGYEHMTDAECSFAFVKRNVRNRIPSNKFIWAVSLECRGTDFWKAVNTIIDTLKSQTS